MNHLSPLVAALVVAALILVAAEAARRMFCALGRLVGASGQAATDEDPHS